MFDHDEFERDFNRTRKFAVAGMLISGAVGIGVLGFLGWVIVKVMAHFGVV